MATSISAKSKRNKATKDDRAPPTGRGGRDRATDLYVSPAPQPTKKQAKNHDFIEAVEGLRSRDIGDQLNDAHDAIVFWLQQSGLLSERQADKIKGKAAWHFHVNRPDDGGGKRIVALFDDNGEKPKLLYVDDEGNPTTRRPPAGTIFSMYRFGAANEGPHCVMVVLGSGQVTGYNLREFVKARARQPVNDDGNGFGIYKVKDIKWVGPNGESYEMYGRHPCEVSKRLINKYCVKKANA